MIDLYIWIAVWVVILIMLIKSLTKIESRIAEERINKMFEYLKERKMTRDVEKIVRCKDCSMNEDGKCRLLVERDPNTDHRIWSEFFCAYGERK